MNKSETTIHRSHELLALTQTVRETSKIFALVGTSLLEILATAKSNPNLIKRPQIFHNSEYLPYRLETTFWSSVSRVVERKMIDHTTSVESYALNLLLKNNSRELNALLRKCYLPETKLFLESICSDYPQHVSEIWQTFEEQIHLHNGVSLDEIISAAIERNLIPEESRQVARILETFGSFDEICAFQYTQEDGITLLEDDAQFILSVIENSVYKVHSLKLLSQQKELSDLEVSQDVQKNVQKKMLFIKRDLESYLKMADDRVLVDRHMGRVFHIQEQLGQHMIELLSVYYQVLQKLLSYSGGDFVEFISQIDQKTPDSESKLNIAMDSGTCAGSGTTAANLVENFGYKEIGMGTIFRSLTLFVLEKKWKVEQLSTAIEKKQLAISIFFDENKRQGTTILYEGIEHIYDSGTINKLTQANTQVKELIPFIASSEVVVLHLNTIINSFIEHNKGQGVVVEGRDREQYVTTADLYVYLYLSEAAIRDRTTRRSEKTQGYPMSTERAQLEADADVARYLADIKRNILPDPKNVLAGHHKYDIAIDTTHYSPKMVFGYILMEMLHKLTEQSMQSKSIQLAAMKDGSYLILRGLINMVRNKSIRYAKSTVVISRT